jgi:cyclohexanone monooxygenase
MAAAAQNTQEFDVAIVGAGFSGLYMLHKVRGLGLTARVFEKGDGVGGTWFWNRYPGARVDIESQEYSFSFSPELEDEWNWSERYAPQPELLRYANHVTDRFDLRRDIQFNTKIESAAFDEKAGRWTLKTDAGEKISARFCVMATGCLSVPKDPDFKGVDTFKGATYHTARWPLEGVDFSGMRVGIIGTGSSAVQTIPQVAKQAKHLTVFQRTPNFSLPARNAPTDPAFSKDWKANKAQYRAEARLQGFAVRHIDENPERLAVDATPEDRQRIFEERWQRGGFCLGGAYGDLITDEKANKFAVDFVHSKIRETVKDPATAELLMPKTYPFFTKRVCIDIDYFETYNRDNVTLIDISAAPITEITPKGVKTANGEYEFDAIIYAIGFDAMTGALSAIDIRGRGGVALSEKWAAGPRTYLGITVSGFPNLFMVTGPGSPSVLANMMAAIEQHVDWIGGCLGYLKDRQVGVIEATEQAETDWVAHVNEAADLTLYPRANSWYIGANVPGKPRVFMPYIGGFPVYAEKIAAVAAGDYEGFTLGR